MDPSEPIFPIEIIMEILIRLPHKTLSQCQLVCKDWQSLINNNRYFTQMHMDHSHFIDHWYNTPTRINNRGQPIYDPTVSFSFTHGCDGLLLMMNNNTKKHYLWNPLTRLVLELPDPSTRESYLALSFVPSTKTYRIVSFFTDKESLLGCEVFTPGQSDYVWRRLLHDDNNNNLDFKVPRSSKQRVTVIASSEKAVHCVVATQDGDGVVNVKVVSLELETEKFMVNHFPKFLDVGWENYWDVDWDGKLAIVDLVGKNMEVVELEDYKKGRWSEKKIISLGRLLKGNEEVLPLLVRDGEIWMWLKDEKIFKYTIATGETSDVKEEKRLSMSRRFYPYKPSLIGFGGMVPDTMLEVYRPTFDRS